MKNEKAVRRVHISAYPAERYLRFDELLEFLSGLDGIELSFSHQINDGGCDLPPDTDALIILASERYFTAKSTGYNSEYLKAKERGILILPLLLEDGIINLLNTRCGKTQYIDAVCDNFGTALEILAEKLSASSEKPCEGLPRVFISYRKSDRRSLDRLLDIISGFECSSGISLWFDGDILPGDNYAKEIFSALSESELVILLVTPALLEEGNFVLRAEFPEAKRLGKRIIAVEAEKTDRRALVECFSGIPAPVSIKQKGAIEAELARIARRKA